MSEEVETQTEAAETAPEQEVTAAPEIVEDKPVKTFTQEELDSIVAKRLAKESRKLQRQAELEAENRLLKERMAPRETKPENAAPKAEDFGSYEEYLEQKAEWIASKRVEEKLAELEKRQAKSREEAERSEVVRTWQQKVEAAVTKYPDYNEALEDVDHIDIPPALTEAIMGSDMGADIAYYLAKNSAELEKIVKLRPHAALMELGKLEVKLSQPPAPKKQVSKAPAPIKPLGGNSSVSTEHSPDDDMATFIRKRNLEKGRIK